MASNTRKAKKTAQSKKRKSLFSNAQKRLNRLRVMAGEPNMTMDEANRYAKIMKDLRKPIDMFNSVIGDIHETLGNFEIIRLTKAEPDFMNTAEEGAPLLAANVTKASEFLDSIYKDIEEAKEKYSASLIELGEVEDAGVMWASSQEALFSLDAIRENITNNTEALMGLVQLLTTIAMSDEESLTKMEIK